MARADQGGRGGCPTAYLLPNSLEGRGLGLAGVGTRDIVWSAVAVGAAAVGHGVP